MYRERKEAIDISAGEKDWIAIGSCGRGDLLWHHHDHNAAYRLYFFLEEPPFCIIRIDVRYIRYQKEERRRKTRRHIILILKVGF